ncbi:MAG: hypothetical protein ABI432_02095 [Flavobacteriales bacterium]
MSNRGALWQGLQRYQAALLELGIHATQWVNGSFVDATRRMPGDVDVLNFCLETSLQRISEEHMDQAAALLDGGHATKADFGCDTHLVIVYPNDDPRNEDVLKRVRDWKVLYGTARNYYMENAPAAPERGTKGFVELTIGDPKLCPHVRRIR